MMADVMSTAYKPVTATWGRPPENRCRECAYSAPGGRWCELRHHFTAWQGKCSAFEPAWVTCKCGEEIERTAGSFMVCPSCGRRVRYGD